MPRSGTTLVEQILASHPSVFGAGELTAIPQLAAGAGRRLGPYPECLRGADAGAVRASAVAYLEHLRALDDTAARVTDKLPGNFLHLGFIHLLFPNAALVHCQREAVDVCLSNYLQPFGEGHYYTYDLADLGFFHRGYERLMAHWHRVLPVPILVVRYEEMVTAQEAVSRRLVEHCGLPWDDRCLRFHEDRRAVHTASVWQVRRPIYRSSVARWRRYEPYLGELLEALGQR